MRAVIDAPSSAQPTGAARIVPSHFFDSGERIAEAGTQGGYHLGKRLGRGTTNEVHEAVHPGVPGRFVIKFFRCALAATAEATEAFRREAARVSGLRHPHCVHVIEIGTRSDGIPFVVMEHLRGETLREHLARRGSVTSAEAVTSVKAIASALAAAHDAEVVHGQLSPEKVFLAEAAGYDGGFVKLLDFGAGRLSTPLGPQREGFDAEAAGFMSSEFASGRLADVDGRSDQFALAAIAYRMLTGANCFPGQDVVTVLYRALHEEPRPVTDFLPCDPGVDRVIRRGLAKDPARRYPSVLAFAEAFEQATLTGVPGAIQVVSESQVETAAPLPTIHPSIAARANPPSGSADRAAASAAYARTANAVGVGAHVHQEQDDDVSESFFAEGERQEALGWSSEPQPPYAGSLDRLPRTHWPMALLLVGLLGLGTAGALFVGWRPPASVQESVLYQRLGLPRAEAPAAVAPTEAAPAAAPPTAGVHATARSEFVVPAAPRASGPKVVHVGPRRR